MPQVMALVELAPLARALVGLPGISGLSVEQRKRLTIAVELVSNPAIVFMDEPTSGALFSPPACDWSMNEPTSGVTTFNPGQTKPCMRWCARHTAWPLYAAWMDDYSSMEIL